MKIFLQILIMFFVSQNLYSNVLPDNLEHGFVVNDGVKIHYVSAGNGPLIVMLHGFPDFWYTWNNQIIELSKKYQTVAIDLRGYNKSDKPRGAENYSMKYLISDVVTVIKHFPQNKAIIIGHDWGGAIAWQVAMRRPELVKKLIVISTPHPNGLSRELNKNKKQHENSQYARDFQKKDAAKEMTAEKLAEWVKDPQAKQLYIDAFNRSDFEAMLNYYKASFPKANSNSNSQVKSKRNLLKIICPTLAIFGLKDKALLASGWNDTWDWIDNYLTLVSIPDAGHFVQHDNSEKVTRLIQEWLNQ